MAQKSQETVLQEASLQFNLKLDFPKLYRGRNLKSEFGSQNVAEEEEEKSITGVMIFMIFVFLTMFIAIIVLVVIMVVKLCKIAKQKRKASLSAQKRIEDFKTCTAPFDMKTDTVKFEQTVCPICLNEYDPEGKYLMISVCNHVFHEECLQQCYESG